MGGMQRWQYGSSVVVVVAMETVAMTMVVVVVVVVVVLVLLLFACIKGAMCTIPTSFPIHHCFLCAKKLHHIFVAKIEDFVIRRERFQLTHAAESFEEVIVVHGGPRDLSPDLVFGW
jgi:hypothetical protein